MNINPPPLRLRRLLVISGILLGTCATASAQTLSYETSEFGYSELTSPDGSAPVLKQHELERLKSTPIRTSRTRIEFADGVAQRRELRLDRSHGPAGRSDDRKIETLVTDRERVTYTTFTGKVVYDRPTAEYELADLDGFAFAPYTRSLLSDPESDYYRDNKWSSNEFVARSGPDIRFEGDELQVWSEGRVVERYDTMTLEQHRYLADTLELTTYFASAEGGEMLYPAMTVERETVHLASGGHAVRAWVTVLGDYRYGGDGTTGAAPVSYSAYPHPAVAILSIDGLPTDAGPASYRVVNLAGQLLLAGTTEGDIDVAALPPGPYAILVTPAGAASFILQFVKS